MNRINKFPIEELEAVIFDMDGVLVDSEPVYFKVEKALFKTLNLDISPEVHRSFVGMSMKMIWKKIKENNKLDLSDEELISLHKKLMIRGFKSLHKPLPINGVIPLLEMLKKNKIKIALASSSSHELIEVILSRTGLMSYFPVKVSGDDVSNGKPEPDIFLRTLELLKSGKNNTLVIEDSTNGVTASLNAGITCAAYDNKSGGQCVAMADMIFSNFNDFRMFLDREIG
ncbi:HAD family hydrolase [Candidatus Cloacimonadota bacterium]